MRFLDLCAGIGGFSLGLEWAGMTCAGQVEINPFCVKALEKHWPNVPRWKDLTNEREYDEYPAVDLVCGGYPCQPFSYSGKRRGTDDDRHLWPHVFRVVQRLRPAWCLFENVAGHITLGLDEVFADLESEGYATGAVVVPACAVGAWHRRDRVWIVAYLDRARKLQPEGREQEQRERADYVHEVDADANQERREKRDAPAFVRELGQHRGIFDQAGILRPTEPALVRGIHGVSGGMDEVGALGNAVVPELVMEFGLAIMCAHPHAE
jgi:DNA (cytosine-5)-methyltransferase 1